ncbi:MAG: radical SAM family heme chaperone HemW [Pseudomonadales bacterium]
MDGLGLYVHFPWCVRKCPYCDFNSHPQRGRLPEVEYVDALLADAADALADVAPGSICSVFCGGGTPSLFSPAAFGRLLDALAPYLAVDVEVTMEANPGTAEHHDFAGYRRAGINRISLGAQSFDDAMLTRLGRIHGAADTGRALALVRRAGFDNVNLDLMYGLPGQTAAAAMADLEAALRLEPAHLSWYQLTIEPKTEFARRPPLLASDSEVEDMEGAGHARLADAGFTRYEVSAYARDGRQCRHNLNYWTFGDYLGIGAGAHGKRSRRSDSGIDVVRTRKASQPRLYLGSPTATVRDAVAPAERVAEFLMNVLRLRDGVPWTRLPEATGLSRDALSPTWDDLVRQGLLRDDRIAATALGYRHLDGVLQQFL